jgi:hypothetical protein
VEYARVSVLDLFRARSWQRRIHYAPTAEHRLETGIQGGMARDREKRVTLTLKQAGVDAPWVCLAIPVVLALVSCTALFWLGHQGWPGEMGVTALMFCERVGTGVVQQPVNCFSNVGFIVVGLWAGWQAMRDRGAQIASGEPVTNRFRASNVAPTLYASAAVLLGPGSMAMHASTTRWGGNLDVISMYIWASFAIVYGWVRLRGLGEQVLVVGYLSLVTVLCGLFFAAPWLDINVIFGLLITSFAGLEFVIRRRRPELGADARWLLAAAALFLLAFGIWIPSRTGGPWCDPDSIIQGHAAWHLLDAAAVACVFQFYRSEGTAGREGAPTALAGERA